MIAACATCDGSGWVFFGADGDYVKEGCEACGPDFDAQEETAEAAQSRMTEAERQLDQQWQMEIRGLLCRGCDHLAARCSCTPAQATTLFALADDDPFAVELP